jgi:hypothetical protein
VQRRVGWDKSGLPVQGLNAPDVSVGRDGSTGHDEFGGGNLGSNCCRFRSQKKEIPVQSVVVQKGEP